LFSDYRMTLYESEYIRLYQSFSLLTMLRAFNRTHFSWSSTRKGWQYCGDTCILNVFINVVIVIFAVADQWKLLFLRQFNTIIICRRHYGSSVAVELQLGDSSFWSVSLIISYSPVAINPMSACWSFLSSLRRFLASYASFDSDGDKSRLMIILRASYSSSDFLNNGAQRINSAAMVSELRRTSRRRGPSLVSWPILRQPPYSTVGFSGRYSTHIVLWMQWYFINIRSFW